MIGFAVATVAVLQIGWGLSAIRSESQWRLSETVHRARQMQAALAVPCGVALAKRELETLDATLSQFAESKHIDLLSVSLLDQAGVVVAHTDSGQFGHRAGDPFSTRSVVSPRSEVELDGQVMRISTPVVSGIRWGTLVTELSMVRFQEQIRQTTSRVGREIIVMCLLTTLVLWGVLSALVLQPVVRLSDAARRMSTGDLKARVPAGGGGHELQLLTEMFNHMAEQVHDHTSNLAELVADRTSEIERVNGQLQQANQEFGQMVDKLSHMARTDGLTGLLNHRALRKALDVELSRARRTGAPLTLMMIDVDHFKNYNDTYGHPAGDEALIRVADVLLTNLRATDVIARYGGEEFAVVLPDTTREAAALVAEKVRAMVASEAFAAEASEPLPAGLTISIGLAVFPDDAQEDRRVIALADRALYAAKTGGRNAVVGADKLRSEES